MSAGTEALASELPVAREVALRAHSLAARLNVREIADRETLVTAPLVVQSRDGGHLVVYRFGAAVAIGVSEQEERELLDRLGEQATDLWEEPEREQVTVIVDPTGREGVDAQGRIVVQALDAGRIQVLANVLAKSSALAYYEGRVAAIFDQVETLAERLRRFPRTAKTRELLRRIGDVMVTQARMVGRVEVAEKPEITWDEPLLDRLYERLALEFELGERDRALTRKLELISDIAHTWLELVRSRQGLRVEWYIVLLILFDIGLTLYEKFWGG